MTGCGVKIGLSSNAPTIEGAARVAAELARNVRRENMGRPLIYGTVNLITG